MKLGTYNPSAQADAGQMPRFSDRAIPGSFGENVGQSIEQAAANVVSPIVEQQQKERERLTQIQLNNAESMLHAAYLNSMNGPDGLRKKTGEDARAAAPDVRKVIGQANEQIQKMDMLPHARDLYMMRAKSMLPAYENSINEYVTEQDKVALKASTRTAMAIGLSQISENYNNPELVAKTAAQVETKLSAFSRTEDGGASEGQHILEWNRSVGTTVIRNFLKEDTESGIAAAKKKLVEYKPFLGEHLATLEGEVKTAEEKVGGLSSAIRASQENLIPNTSLVNEANARNSILTNDKLTPMTKMYALTHLQTLMREGQIAQRQSNEGAFSRVYSTYRNGGFAKIPATDVAYLKDQPEHQGVELWQKFLEIVRSDALHAENKPETEGERIAYGRFLADYAAHKDKFADMSMERFQADYHAGFNPKRRVEADSLVASLKAPAAQTEGLTHDEMRMVLQYGRSNGYFKETDPTLWTPEDESRMEFVTRQIVGQRTLWMQSHPKQKPGPEEVQKWVKGIYDTNVVLNSGVFRDTRVNAIDINQNPTPYRGKTIIPAAQLKQIDEALDKVNLSHDDSNREFLYRKFLEQGQAPELLRPPNE
jgi:hypothetical protein